MQNNPLSQRPLPSQLLSYVGIILNADMLPDKKLAALYTALGKSIENFDDAKIGEYRLACNEMLILNEIALVHAQLGNHNNAIHLLEGIVGNIENSRLTTSEKAQVTPKPHADLAALLLKTQAYEKAAKVCERMLDMFKQLYGLPHAPKTAYTLGVCLQKMNKDEKEYMYWLTVAYHAARGTGQSSLADKIREEYGIS